MPAWPTQYPLYYFRSIKPIVSIIIKDAMEAPIDPTRRPGERDGTETPEKCPTTGCDMLYFHAPHESAEILEMAQTPDAS